MKVLFGFLCINKIYCKRGVLSAKISTYPAFTGESGFEDREIVSTHPGYSNLAFIEYTLLISLYYRFHFVVLL